MDFLNIVVAIHEQTGVEIAELDYPKLSTLSGAEAYLTEGRKRAVGTWPITVALARDAGVPELSGYREVRRICSTSPCRRIRRSVRRFGSTSTASSIFGT
jgi:hypothetical protein